MGKRRGRTGPGGAVVSSLSDNAGGTIRSNRRGEPPRAEAKSKGRKREDPELAELANLSNGKARKNNASASGSASGQTEQTLSLPSAAPKWLGKSPKQMLREWCTKNNRIRPYFSEMAGGEGIVRCTIPQGRKDGKKVKGTAFDRIIGVGDFPGEEYAALNVLHQVERGKPLERLLAPEFRPVWLDLDKRFDEVEKEQNRREQMKQKRKENAERRARFEKANESATINISTTSRQMIEDALLEHKESQASSASDSQLLRPASGEGSNPRQQQSLKEQLVRMGFAEFDALDASRRFSQVTDAIDYLCLNLDEAELPPSFAPTSDVEVVQFYSGSGKQPRGRINESMCQLLVNMLCLSKHSAEKALRKADGDLVNAARLLFNTLTHDVLAEETVQSPTADMLQLAGEEKAIEAETLTAIYAEDVKVGIGAMDGVNECWAAVVTMREGCPALRVTAPVIVSFLDVDRCYPFSAPVIVINTSPTCDSEKQETLSLSQRRILVRSAAAEVATLRKSMLGDGNGSGSLETPIPVVHAVLSFLSDASSETLMASLSKRPGIETQGSKPRENKSTIENQRRSGNSGTTSGAKHSPLHFDKPRPVSSLKPSPELDAMRKRRTQLPAHNARSEILAKVKQHQVVVVSGATGSGKTTQVPQFLLEDAAVTRNPISIICTQPRRIAAMSVADRVAAERCQKVGESVGYQVKLNTKRSRSTRLLFCTTGVLLRRLQGDPNLDTLTHILVDEVHERSVETDFLLLLLRQIAARRPSLKIVLMSATLDANKFAAYFGSELGRTRKTEVPIISIPGRTFPVSELYLHDAVSLSQYRIKPGDRYAKRVGKVAHKGKYGQDVPDDAFFPPVRNSASAAVAGEAVAMDDERELSLGSNKLESWNVADSEVETSFKKRQVLHDEAGHNQTVSLVDESVVNVDLIDVLVKKIDEQGRQKGDQGAILIFLPGAADISNVLKKLTSGPGAHFLWVLPLHSLLSPDEQNRVFSKAPKGKRKVICATNIAETSITVDDVKVVIDTLRAKEMGYDALNHSSVLEEVFISKAAAKQRAGRAGRVSEGTCYRLVRQHTFENKLAAQQTPEIRRVALEQLILHMLSIIPVEQSQNDPHMFLSKAIDPPETKSITTAIENLIAIGALRRCGNEQVELTALGKHLTGMPVDARIGKLLIFGSLFSCVDAALTIAATISERSPFFSPFDKRDEARKAREQFVWGKSDLLTYVKAFNAWRELRQSRQGFNAETEFCTTHFLSRKTLMSIADSRRQLADALADAGFGCEERGWESDPAVNEQDGNVRVIRAIVCASLYPHIARIDLPDTTYTEVASGTIANKYNAKDLRLRTRTNGRLERVFLHPESINFDQGNYDTRWLAYYAKVKTSKLFIRDATQVSPYALLLFGGDISVRHERGQMAVDGWIVFKAPARVAVLARELRRQLDGLLLAKFERPEMELGTEGKAINDAILRLITTES